MFKRQRLFGFFSPLKRMMAKLRGIKQAEESGQAKEYILWVTTEHQDGGYSSRWHGWSQGLRFTYDDAMKEKERIQDKFFDVEVVEM